MLKALIPKLWGYSSRIPMHTLCVIEVSSGIYQELYFSVKLTVLESNLSTINVLRYKLALTLTISQSLG